MRYRDMLGRTSGRGSSAAGSVLKKNTFPQESLTLPDLGRTSRRVSEPSTILMWPRRDLKSVCFAAGS